MSVAESMTAGVRGRLKDFARQMPDSSSFDVPDAILVREGEANAPALVVFSSVNSNGFSFYRNFEKLPFTRIYVRDPFDRWFQRGVGEGIDSPDALAAHLAKAIKTLRPQRVVSVGASMGGYAALLFGHLLRASAIFAMSPQTIIDRRLPHTPPEDFFASPYFDLGTTLRTKNRHRPATHILYGSDDIVDIWNATRVVTLPGDCSFPVAGRDHLASLLVTANGDLASVVTKLAMGEAPEITAATDRRCEEQRIRQIVDRLVRALYLQGADLDEDSWAARLGRLHPDWSVPYDVMAALAKRRGDFAAAEMAARRAGELAPTSITLQTNHAEILMQLGWEEQAMTAFERCLAIRPKHYAALCALGMLKARAGDADEALRRLQTAIEIRPRLTRAYAIRDAILAGATPKLPRVEERPDDM